MAANSIYMYLGQSLSCAQTFCLNKALFCMQLELQHMGEAFAAARSQLRERMSRESSMAADRLQAQQYPGQPATYAGMPTREQQGFYGGQPRPNTSRPEAVAQERPDVAPQMRQWSQGQLSGAAGSRHELAGYGPGPSYTAGSTGPQPLSRDVGPPEALRQQQQQLAALRQSMHGSSAEAAAAHEEWRRRNLEAAQNVGGREAGPPPAALRSLSFEWPEAAPVTALAAPRWSGSREAEFEAAPPGVSPMDPAGCNPRASLPQPYNLVESFRASITPEGLQALGSGDRSAGAESDSAVAATGAGPGSSGNLQPRSRLSSNAEDSIGAPASATRDQVAVASPFGNDISMSVRRGLL